MTVIKTQIRPYPLGAHCEGDKIRFSLVSKAHSCGIVLYDRATRKEIQRMAFTEEERVGNVHCKYISGFDSSKIAYQFYEGDKVVADERARMFIGNYKYGKERGEAEMFAGFPVADFDWGEDVNPCIPYHECMCYCLHVRGFTKHTSSGVSKRGTFAGVAERIPYLKETGITTVELQPVYEFTEMANAEEKISAMPYPVPGESLGNRAQCKLNYWGYTKGYYYAPKAAYAASGDAITELKEMVKAFHANGMEVIMQFYFPKEVSRGEIVEILRFWVLEYHVDGFHLMGEALQENFLAQDALLAHTKLWYYSFDTESIYGEDIPEYRNLATYNDEYLYALRRYLKGDEGMLDTVMYQMRHIPVSCGKIHYLSNYYGMTLADMVAYDRKHNEANGEENRDGNDYNCSWNCGEEGVTRKKKVLALRRQQLRNAMLLLLLSQSTPLIFMGDEFGNSQKGNNNPYCQDNQITWLDWRDLEKNRELYDFWKKIVEFRREHTLLHPATELRIMDYRSLGYPDLSYHGQNAWRVQTERYQRHMGIMLCGKYAEPAEEFLYLAYNLHWESHELALPKLPKGSKWELWCTSDEAVMEAEEHYAKISPRSIAVYRSVPAEVFAEETKKQVLSGKKKKVDQKERERA